MRRASAIVSAVLTVCTWLPAFAASATRPRGYVQELEKEGRLPEWANYVCYQDARNIDTGLFMLIAYTPISEPFLFFKDATEANRFGYTRALTYQEYIGSDTDVTTINMPISSGEYESAMHKATQTGKVRSDALEFFDAQMLALQDEIALTKKVRQMVAEYPYLEKEFLADEENRALLDAPEGSNYQSFVRKHPAYAVRYLDWLKYYNAGIKRENGYKAYSEGNVIFERNFGADVFEAAKDRGAGALSTRIQIEDTQSGLRFLQSHTMGSSGIGIPVSGRCDKIVAEAPTRTSK